VIGLLITLAIVFAIVGAITWLERYECGDKPPR
jgi:predicted outer membrane lipoprotein